MAGVLSLMSMVLGATIAYVADRFPAHVETLETSAGALLIGGLALLGCALPTIL
jgi:putative Mn2+ efflux pump MntP